MFIVEGPDNSGKSTLVDFIARMLDIPKMHSGGPGKDTYEFFSRCRRLINYPDHVVFDRFPVISEHVYAPILRGVDTFGGNNPIWRHELLKRMPIIIYCRPPLDVLLDLDNHPVKVEHEDAEHVESVKRNALRLAQRYDEVIIQDYPNAIYYDYTAGGPQFRRLLLNYLYCKM